ncbi:GOLPH3/VPS74 family protein [Streptomyces mayteni]
MQEEPLLVEEVMLLLLDDETGVPAAAGTLHYTLGGAVLVELALRGEIDVEESGSKLSGPRVVTVGTGDLADPLLRSAYEKVAERPRGVQTALLEIGGGLRKPVIDRLVERGLIRRESRRVLGIFPSTRLPADDTRHEAALRRRVCAALEDGETPDTRTAAVIALLSAGGALPSLHPAPKWSTKVHQRGKEFEQGSWGAVAVSTAVARTAAAITAATTVTTVTVITSQ